jgi:exonuclease III
VNTTLNPDYLPTANLAQGADMRIMSTNVLFDKVSIPLRAEIFEDYYRIYQPDTIGLQEMIREWKTALYPLISDLYGVCDPVPSDGVQNYTPILYLKDKYEVVETGVTRFRKGRNPWLVTWAVFQNKQTGERFIHCNTHYTVVTDGDRATNPSWTNATKGVEWRLEDAAAVRDKVLELQAKYNNIPAVLTGDFNSNQFSQEYGTMKYQTDIRTTMLVATISSMKDYRSYHTLGLSDRGGNDGNSIDHVMVTTDTVNTFIHKILYDEIIVHASDHCPVYADIAFK